MYIYVYIYMCVCMYMYIQDADVSAAPAAGAALEGFGSFPPKFRDIPCKPLLCDLAYQSFEAPGVRFYIPNT